VKINNKLCKPLQDCIRIWREHKNS